MRYTTLGKTGLKVSALGFGCMRLPMADGRVDREKSTPLLRRAFDLGVNVFDSAVMYCNGDSQAAIGDAFKGMRDKVILSTKNPLRDVTGDEWWKTLEDSLRLLQTDYIDIYHHHGIGWEDFVKHFDPDKGGHTKLMLKAKEQGLIRHIGFSFHDVPESLIKLADTGYYENVILQYNMLDQANADALQYAHEKGMGVVVMGPVGGGRLGIASEQITALTGAKSTPEAALRFVWGHSGVNIALSGMENLIMLEENAAIASNTKPFAKDEIAGLNALVAERKQKSGLYCTACKYCMPACPRGIKIPENLELLNQVLIFGLGESAKERYSGTDVKAVECINCGKCMPLCPQGIKIPEKLAQAALLLDPAAGTVIVDTSIKEIAGDGAFSMALEAFNFVNRPREVTVQLSSETGMTFENPRVTYGSLKAMGRKTVLSKGTMVLAEGRQQCNADIMYDGSSHLATPLFDSLMVSRTEPSWSMGVWHEAHPSTDDIPVPEETLALHSLRFRLVYDDAALTLLADVADDFLFPGCEEKHKGQMIDGLELYLDGRGTKVGNGAYEKGVYQVMVYPGTPGEHAPFYSSSQGIEGLKLEAERTKKGYRILVRVPFASFCIDKGKPAKIGFDIGVNTANKSGNRIGQYIFAGTKNNWRDASNFITAWLI